MNASLGWSHYAMQDGDHRPFRTFTPNTLVPTFVMWRAPGVLSSLSIGGGASYQSKTHSTVSSPNGATEFPQGSVVLLNATARYPLTPAVSVQLNANNILSRKYYVLDNYDNTYYGAPASFSLGVSIRL